MDIINRQLIEEAKKEHANWRGSLKTWEKIAIGAIWRNPVEVRLTLKSADPYCDCVIFNIAHNEARLISLVHYQLQTLTILAILSHKQYDKDGWKDACNC